MSEEKEKDAIRLMETVVPVWGISSSPLTFAYENDMRDVVAHPCSQKSVIRQWYNYLAPGLVPFVKVKQIYMQLHAYQNIQLSLNVLLISV